MERGSYLCESSLGGSACWRAFIGKRLVRRGLEHHNILVCSNSVVIKYARNIKQVALVFVNNIMNIAFYDICFINLKTEL